MIRFKNKLFNIKYKSFIILKYSRFYCSNDVRVRFAPSPTGYLHLGGLRTALYNYLFAKSKGGKFILRIEDTDQTRLITGAAEQLQKDLNWAGIKIDEGPNINEKYGPYVQSKRLHLYKEQVEVLLDNNSAYYCFCTDRRLNLIKKEALKLRQVPKYDNKCRNLTKEEVEKRLKRGDKYCIRFKLLSDCETFEDMIYGNIAYDVALNEGDPVIMKGDNFPTYHFANVVDDHFMNITHVLRGVEWQISTTKHILMYRAFNWNPPVYGHLPLLLNSDGSKLSKRQGDIQISKYKEDGIFPQALVNFVISCGGGFEKDQGIKQQCYTMDDLIEMFKIDRVNSNSTKLVADKLLEFNRLQLAKNVTDDSVCDNLVTELQNMVKIKFSDEQPTQNLLIDDDYVKSILKWATSRINKLSDLLEKDLLFLWIQPNSNDCLTEDKLNIIKALNDALTEQINFNKEYLKRYLKEFASENNIGFDSLMKMMRSILSGLKEGPSVVEMMEILGKDNTILRLTEFIKLQRRFQ